MKKIILPIFFLLFSSVSQADSLNMTTVLKPPINTFKRLQLLPQATDPDPNYCIDGTIFLNSSYEIKICMNHSFHIMGSPWLQNGNIIYLQDWLNENINVGIGTTSPSQKFEVSKATTTFPGKSNSIQVKTSDSLKNSGMAIITRGESTGTLFGAKNNWASFIDFQAGPGTGGRIIYAYRRNAANNPWAASGLGIASAPDNAYDIWMDADNGNVGVGVGADPLTQADDLDGHPNYQLEVYNGNLKTNTIYLTAPDGSNTAELKTTFTAGEYYAVFAP